VVFDAGVARRRGKPAIRISPLQKPGQPPDIDPRIHATVVAFLRDWLPEEAKRQYRDMIARDPDGWSHDPHFQGDVVIEHVFRGNGIDERLLGVPDLRTVWPDLLKSAVDPG
jgi:hypothetical protein